MTDSSSPRAVLDFWRHAGRKLWFAKDDGFDAECRGFEALWRAATDGLMSDWEAAADSALALVLLLDQMSRNMFRGTARVYASDPQARAVADRAIARGFDRQVDAAMRLFFYLPFAHSEMLADQERSVALATALGEAETMKSARRHHDIVARFGRFPHRNVLLGRESTPEEEAWLKGEDAFKG